jgi:hypothetical protein
MENIKSYVQQKNRSFYQRINRIIKDASVSADPAYSQDVIETWKQ